MAGRTIALYGQFGIGNLGNDATLEAILHHGRRRLPEGAFLCVTPAVGVVGERYGLACVDVDPHDRQVPAPPRSGNLVARAGRWAFVQPSKWRLTAQTVAGISDLVIAGTGAVDDFGVSPMGVPYDLLRWCASARSSGSRVVFASVGVGPIVHPLSRRLMVRALRHAHYRSYRDLPSRDFLERLGFPVATDPIYPDLAFSLAVPEDARRPPQAPPRVVGLGVMGYYGWKNDPASGEAIYRAYLEKLTRFASWLLDGGYAVRLLIGEAPSDRRPAEDLFRAVQPPQAAHAAPRIAEDRIETVQDVFHAIARTDLVVATRYHTVISALMLGRPVISLGYAEKNQALVTDAGLGAYAQHVERFDVARLQADFLRLAGGADAARRRVIALVETFRAALDEQYDLLFGKPHAPAVAS